MEEEIDELQGCAVAAADSYSPAGKGYGVRIHGPMAGGTGRSLQGGNAMSHQLANDVSDILFDLDPAFRVDLGKQLDDVGSGG